MGIYYTDRKLRLSRIEDSYFSFNGTTRLYSISTLPTHPIYMYRMNKTNQKIYKYCTIDLKIKWIKYILRLRGKIMLS